MRVCMCSSITCRPSYTCNEEYLKNQVRLHRGSNSSFVYTIPGSTWPTDSLSASLEGSVIEMKSAILVQETKVYKPKSLASKSHHNL